MDERQKERLAELRQREAERGQAAQEADDARELEALELSASLESKGATRGADFLLVSNRLCGVFAIRKPGGKEIRTWEMAKEKDRLNLEWMISFLRPMIVDPSEVEIPKVQAGQTPPHMAPDARVHGRRAIEWAQQCGQRPGLCWQTANAFVELMGVDREAHDRK